MRGQAERQRISAETAERVHAAAREMGYVPNVMARALRRQRSHSIGVLMMNLQFGWAESVIESMNEVLGESDYTPFIAIHQMVPQRARKEVLSCLERRDEGVIYQPVPGETESYSRLQRAGVPVIFLGDRPEDVPDVSFVGWDSGPAARTAVQHLIETGRKRIGYLGVDYPLEMTRARYAAYEAALREAGLDPDDRWIAKAPLDWRGERFLNQSVDRMFAPGCDPPDAIFAGSDALALTVLEFLHDRGLRVPDDVAVMGMGDLPMARHSTVSLSTMKEPTEGIGRQAAQLMLDLIADRGKGPVHRLIRCDELKARRTTLPPTTSGSASRDGDVKHARSRKCGRTLDSTAL